MKKLVRIAFVVLTLTAAVSTTSQSLDGGPPTDCTKVVCIPSVTLNGRALYI